MKPTTLAFLTFITASGTSFGATTYASQLLVNFDGSLTGTTYTLGVGETDTTGTFQANGTPTITAGSASLAGGTSNDGFKFNPTTLGALTTQNWVAETIINFDAFQTGQRTMIDVQGDTDFRVNAAANGLEANFWDGAPANTNLTAALPGTGITAHYALVWNAATNELTAYIDGESIGTTSGSGAFNTPDLTNVSFGYLGRTGFVGRSIDGSLGAVSFATFTGSFDRATDLQLFTPLEYVYWDTDNATPGAGGAAPSGNWGDANWSASAAGDVSTVNWIDGSNAAFSAGTDATDPYEVALGAGTRQIGALRVEEGNVLLSGGTLQVAADGGIKAMPGSLLTISSALNTGNVKFTGNVELSGATTISGGLVVSSGLLLLNIPVTVGALSGGGSIGTGTNDFTAGGAVDSSYSGILSGTGAVTKHGAGILTFGRLANTFSGPLVVANGTLATGIAAGAGTTSYLGAVDGTRTITVQPGATLRLAWSNVFGGGGKTAATLPAYQLDGGTLRTDRFNIVGNVTLNNGATLVNASNETDPNYGGFQLLGTVTASGGPAPCQILNGGTSTRPIHLLGAGTTSFNVANLTASAAADLIVSCALANGSGDYPGTAALTKTGLGTLLLNGANTYTGLTTVSGGVLGGTGSLAGPLTVEAAGTLAPGASVGTITVVGTTILAGTYACEINGSISDKLAVTGNLTLSGPLTVTATAPSGSEWVIASYTGTVSGSFSSVPSGYTVTTGGGEVKLVAAGGGGYTDWAAIHAGGGPFHGDFDNDGMKNGLEYFMGATGSSFTPNPGLVGGTVSYPRDPAATGVSFKVFTSPNLVTWTNVTGSADVSDPNFVKYTPATGLGKVFVRLEVTQP